MLAAAVILLAAGIAFTLVRGERAPIRRSRQAAIRQALFDEIQPVKVSNCVLERFGEPHDGGYALCGNLLGAVKAGYSYGISGYDGWGCDVSHRVHVPVHQYDCFNLTVPICPGGATIFHGECIGPVRSMQDGRAFDTLAGQFDKNGDTEKPLVMKMDVEGAEWDSFLLAPDAVFEHIDQLTVEFHNVGEDKFVATLQRLKQYFVVAHLHYNNFSCDASLSPFPSWAFEVLLVNKRIAKSDGSPAAAGPLAIDAPNDVNAPDCQAF
jgi:hypothetical protein